MFGFCMFDEFIVGLGWLCVVVGIFFYVEIVCWIGDFCDGDEFVKVIVYDCFCFGWCWVDVWFVGDIVCVLGGLLEYVEMWCVVV